MGERRSGRSCAEEPGQGAAPDMQVDQSSSHSFLWQRLPLTKSLLKDQT